jgi:hypothetical protein
MHENSLKTTVLDLKTGIDCTIQLYSKNAKYDIHT